MSKKRPPAPVLVLRFRGDGRRFIFGVPTRDLTDVDLARLVYRDPRTARLAPTAPGFEAAAAARRASLVRSGLYEELPLVTPVATAAAPATPATPDPAPAATPDPPEPTAPAEPSADQVSAAVAAEEPSDA